MDNLSQYIEHTLLKQDAGKEALLKLFEEAKEYEFKGVCVNPCNVALAKEKLRGSKVKVVTVVGFPLGASVATVKAFEAETAIADGADEIDMVLNVGALKDKNYPLVKSDIETVKKACKNHVLKVILETDLLEKDEIQKACEICASAGADFVKTSTGFVKNGAGARVEDVELMHKTVAPYGLGVKASGGIRDREKALALVKAGAARLGTSSGVQIVKGDE